MPPHHVTRWKDETFRYVAEKYDLTVELVYHERVQDIHKSWYLSTFFRSLLFENKLIDTSLARKIVSKIINILSIFLVKNLKEETLPNGHTVLVVFSKNT